MALINGLFYSKSLEFSTNVTIIMPDDIKENEEINVLFLLHGFNGGYLDFIRHTSVEKIALKNRVAVIMPEANNSFYTNTGYGQKYYDYIAYELPNIIKNMFNIKITKKNNECKRDARLYSTEGE